MSGGIVECWKPREVYHYLPTLFFLEGGYNPLLKASGKTNGKHSTLQKAGFYWVFRDHSLPDKLQIFIYSLFQNLQVKEKKVSIRLIPLRFRAIYIFMTMLLSFLMCKIKKTGSKYERTYPGYREAALPKIIFLSSLSI